MRDLRDPAKRERARSVLRRTEVEAHAAMDRLEQKLAGRVPADDLAQELADDAACHPGGGRHRSSPRPDCHEPRPAGRRSASIAGAIRNLAVPDAAPAQAKAIRVAERAARCLAGPGPRRTALPRRSRGCNAAQALADGWRTARKSPASPSKATAAGTTKAAAAAGRARAAEPELAVKPEHADRAADLLRRERRIRERLLAILGRAGPARSRQFGTKPLHSVASSAILVSGVRASEPIGAVSAQGLPITAHPFAARTG